MNRLLVGLVLSMAVLACGLPEGAVAQGARPDLNGVWRLNVAESDFGQVAPPVKQSEEVTQAGEEMAIAVSIERPEAEAEVYAAVSGGRRRDSDGEAVSRRTLRSGS